MWKCDFGVGGWELRETGRLYNGLIPCGVYALFIIIIIAVTLRNRAGTVRMLRSGSAFFFYIQPF